MRRLIVIPAVIVAVPLLAAALSPKQKAAILAPTSQFTSAERWEELPGGSATNRKRFDRDAFSQPSANLDFETRAKFFIGNGLFRRLWVSSPSSTRAADGLGPVFNARSCQRCHLKDGRGHPPEGPDDSAVSMFLRLSVPPVTAEEKQRLASLDTGVIPEPTYGGQFQDLSVPGIPAEGRMTISYTDQTVELAGGEVVTLRKPEYGVADLGYGPMRDDVMFSPRVAPPMIGLGLLEAIAEKDLLTRADPDDVDGDGISGRPSWVKSKKLQRVALGRFGWKGGNATLLEQSSGAMGGDIGVSNPLAPSSAGDCTEKQTACQQAPHGPDKAAGGFEISGEMMDLIVFYSSHLAVPARRDAGEKDVLAGKELFYDIGCIACHTPKHATARGSEFKELSGQLIWPYTDLLLHDMGPGLADNRPEGVANGQEWKTPPLWGIGFTKTVNGHTYFLHDGRARNLQEAILWHGGEGQASRDAYAGLSPEDRELVLKFLGSL